MFCCYCCRHHASHTRYSRPLWMDPPKNRVRARCYSTSGIPSLASNNSGPFLPLSLFWLGWTNYQTISIWSGLFACGIFGIVLISIYISSYEYIIDSYGKHAASALASITMVRYLVAGGMVMASRPMYEGIGVHWTMTILGCISLLLAPMPLLFKNYGAHLRERSRYADSPVHAKLLTCISWTQWYIIKSKTRI